VEENQMIQECPLHKVYKIQVRELIEQGCKTNLEICRILNGNLHCPNCLGIIREQLIEHDFKTSEDKVVLVQKCLSEINDFLKASSLIVEPRDFIEGTLILGMSCIDPEQEKNPTTFFRAFIVNRFKQVIGSELKIEFHENT
jgi:bacterioferritin-associated ferredoxin